MRAMVFGLALLALAGCGGADDGAGAPMSCVPGAQVECACPGGAKGAQACDDDGGGYGACQCGGASTGGAGASGTGSAATTTATNSTTSGSATTSAATTGAGGGPAGDACPTGCPTYQVCSDGTDGHERGTCWGCVKITDSGFCNPATYDLYVNCGAPVPVGCYLQDGDRYCCKR